MTAITTFFFLSLLAGAWSDDTCEAEQQDNKVYSFRYGRGFVPYFDVNEDGEVYGFAYNLVHEVCKVMKKKCAHVAVEDNSFCWDITMHSQALYNRWWDVCVGYVNTIHRQPSVGFVMEFSKGPEIYMYTKKGARRNTVGEIKSSSTVIGFINFWSTTSSCLERFLGISLMGRIDGKYTTYSDLADALDDGKIEVFLMYSNVADDDSRFERVISEPIRCSLSGLSMMMRKDMVNKFGWMEEGFQKVRDNGDYDWFCNNAERDGDPRCF